MTFGTRKRVAILGCTGSVGTQALDVCRQHADALEVVALSAHTDTARLVEAARTFKVHAVCVSAPEHAQDPQLQELPQGCERYAGLSGMTDLVTRDDIDIVLVAIVGAAGLMPSLSALRAGKRLALANKEALVIGGDLLMPLAADGMLLPVDSEHSALLQCLASGRRDEVHALWLTCSGGPFFGANAQDLAHVTPEQALAHPTWSMGSKISIDSATLMNKGLERIEAMHLFSCSVDDVRVLIQRQSKIHSMVEYIDGSVIAHLGASDMRIPIQYALSYPERWDTPVARVDFRTLGGLDFAAPDMQTFRCLALAEEAARAGGTAPCVLNAANEVAVQAFLDHACTFLDIATITERCLEEHEVETVASPEQLESVDAWARSRASFHLSQLS